MASGMPRKPCGINRNHVKRQKKTVPHMESLSILLQLPDNKVKSILYRLCQYMTECKIKDKAPLYDTETIPILFMLAKRTFQITKLAIRMIDELIEFDNVNDVFEENPEYQTLLINMYLEAEKSPLLEYTTKLLIKVFHTLENDKEYLCPQILQKIFDQCSNAEDPDIVDKSLELFLCLLKTNDSLVFMSNNHEICNLDTLISLHRCFDVQIREKSFKIVEKLSTLPSIELKTKWREYKLMNKYVEMMNRTDFEWDNSQNSIVSIITTCIKRLLFNYEDIKLSLFENYIMLTPVNETPKSYGRLAILCTLIKNQEGFLLLSRLGIEEIVYKYLILECCACQVLACTIIRMFIVKGGDINIYNTTRFIDVFADIIKNENQYWSPFRECPIDILCTMIERDDNILDVLKEKEILTSLTQFIINHKHLNPVVVSNLVTISNKVLKYDEMFFRSLFENEHVLKALMELHEDKQFSVQCKSLALLYECLRFPICRMWFEESNAMDTLMEIYKASTEIKKGYVMPILELMFTNQETSRKFLKRGYVPYLKSPLLNPKTIQFAKSLLATVYDLDMSYKFHDTKRLSEYDYVTTGFHLYTGHNKFQPFPLITKGTEDATAMHTIIVVIFKNEQLIQLENVQFRAPHQFGPRFIPHALTRPRQEYYPLRSLGKMAYVLYDDTLTCQRLHLMHMMTEHKSLLNKIKIIANCVYSQLSGGLSRELTEDDYEEHIIYIKSSLRSSIIPLGILRCGWYVERALLFKTYADQFNIKCTLNRGTFPNVAWNTVPVPEFQDGGYRIKNYIIDLIFDIGAMYAIGSRHAVKYTKGAMVSDWY